MVDTVEEDRHLDAGVDMERVDKLKNREDKKDREMLGKLTLVAGKEHSQLVEGRELLRPVVGTEMLLLVVGTEMPRLVEGNVLNGLVPGTNLDEGKSMPKVLVQAMLRMAGLMGHNSLVASVTAHEFYDNMA